MVRNYKRQPGSRDYCNCTEETLQMALSSIRNGKFSIRKASKTYNIPYGKLQNKINNQHKKKNQVVNYVYQMNSKNAC